MQQPRLQIQGNVTDFVQERHRSQADRARGESWRRRMEEAEADLLAAAQALRAALDAEALATRRLTTLVDLARQLGGCESVAELTDIVINRGLAALGADGGAVAVREEGTDLLRLTITDSLGAGTQRAYAELPLDGPLPACVAAHRAWVLLRTGPPRWPGAGDSRVIAHDIHTWWRSAAGGDRVLER
jgi:hypothetical protein